MPSFDEVVGGFAQGAGDVGRSAAHGPGDAWWAAMQNRYPVASHLTGDMERTTSPQEPPPQSYGAALREYSDNEQAEIRSRHEAKQAAEVAGNNAGPATSAASATGEPSVSAPTGEASPHPSYGPHPSQGLNGETLAPEQPWPSAPSAFDRVTGHHTVEGDYQDVSGQPQLPGPSSHSGPSQGDYGYEPEIY